jgi:hypothetical protein
MKIQIGLLIYHTILVKWPVYLGVVVPSLVLPSWVTDGTTTLRHTGHLTNIMIYQQTDLYFQVTLTDPEPPWWWQTNAEIVGAGLRNKAVVQISAYCWSFLLSLIMHGTNIKLQIKLKYVLLWWLVTVLLIIMYLKHVIISFLILEVAAPSHCI